MRIGSLVQGFLAEKNHSYCAGLQVDRATKQVEEREAGNENWRKKGRTCGLSEGARLEAPSVGLSSIPRIVFAQRDDY